MLQNRLDTTYHKVDEVVGGVTVVDKLIVDDDEVLDGAFVVVSKHYVVRPEVSVRQGMQWTRRGVLWIRIRSMHCTVCGSLSRGKYSLLTRYVFILGRDDRSKKRTHFSTYSSVLGPPLLRRIFVVVFFAMLASCLYIITGMRFCVLYVWIKEL